MYVYIFFLISTDAQNTDAKKENGIAQQTKAQNQKIRKNEIPDSNQTQNGVDPPPKAAGNHL